MKEAISTPRKESPFSSWRLVLLIWVAIIFLDFPGQPPQSLRLGWPQLMTSAIEWSVWALLAPIIVFLDRRQPRFRGEFAKRLLLLHVPLCIAMSLAMTFFYGFIVKLFLHQSLDPIRDFSEHARIYWAIAGIYIAWDRQARATQLERGLSNARLDSLRAQLRPHFLLNAFNAISAEVDRDPRTARWMIEQLAELLRFSLDHSTSQEVALKDELDLTDRYVTIQKMRFRNRLTVHQTVDPNALDLLVPAFMIQHLVENSIRHGTERQSTPSVIDIRAELRDGAICVTVQDNGPGISNGRYAREAAGIGLRNTRERLDMLYGRAEDLIFIESAPGTGVRVEIRIPPRRLGDLK